MAPSSVIAVAVYDRVSYKPQEALDAADMAGKRITSYFDKGEVREIPAKEFDRLTTGPFAAEPAVRKASSDEAESGVAASAQAPAEETFPPPETIGQGAGRSEAQAESGTPLDPTSVANRDDVPGSDAAALDALNVKTLTKLARDNQVPISASDRKADLVQKLSAANVRPAA